MGNYQELEIWQRSMRLTVDVYTFTARFPGRERFGLTAQVRRAALSVPANIAEGRGRGTDREFGRFLGIAYGSLLEVETLVRLSAQLGLTDEKGCTVLLEKTGRLGRMINAMTASLRWPADGRRLTAGGQ